jgi:hypothetical protein
MKSRLAAILLVAALCSTALSAQSNQVMDELLNQEQARWAQTAYMLLVCGKWIAESETPEEALKVSQDRGWVSRSAMADDSVTLGAFSLLAMKALRMGGGLGWSLLPIPYYSLRELAALGIANVSGGEARVLAGEEVIRMIGKIVAVGGGQK